MLLILTSEHVRIRLRNRSSFGRFSLNRLYTRSTVEMVRANPARCLVRKSLRVPHLGRFKNARHPLDRDAARKLNRDHIFVVILLVGELSRLKRYTKKQVRITM